MMAMMAQMMQVVDMPIFSRRSANINAGMMVTNERMGTKYRKAIMVDVDVILFEFIFFSVSSCMVFFCKDSIFFKISKAEDVLPSA